MILLYNIACSSLGFNAYTEAQGMASTAMLGDEAVQAVLEMVQQPETARELRAGLNILIPKECRVSDAATARVLSVGVATVVRMQKRFAIKSTGNRRKKAIGADVFVKYSPLKKRRRSSGPWVEKAETGGVLVVPPIHAALEEQLGLPVAASKCT